MDADDEAVKRLCAFVRSRGQAVVATASRDGVPQAALMEVAVTPRLEFIFETSAASRKYTNLISNAHASLVVGWTDDQTLQVDGLVDAPEDEELTGLKAAYFSTFPVKALHEAWPGSFFRLRPSWARLSNFHHCRKIEEFHFPGQESRADSSGRWWSRLIGGSPRRQHN